MIALSEWVQRQVMLHPAESVFAITVILVWVCAVLLWERNRFPLS